MRVIIAGAGEVGFHVAKLLTHEGHNITVIDKNPDQLNHILNHLDLDGSLGSSTSIATLTQAGVSRADLVIGVTSSEDVNLTTCIIAKHLGAKKTIARINNVEFLMSREKSDMLKMGIDELISPAALAAKEIKRLCKESALTDFVDFDRGKLFLVGLKVEHNSKVAGKTIEETAHLNPNRDFLTVSVLRNNETIIPNRNTRFLVNDHAYFIANDVGLERILDLFKKHKVDMHRIMILGGSSVGFHAAKELSKKYRVKLIEPNKDRCIDLANQLPDTLIIHSDGRNVDTLKEEDISEMDAFIAVTGNSETNIIASLLAKNQGVQKTIALVDNMDYIHLSQSIGVDTLINKKLIAANFIFRYIRRGEVLSLTTLNGVDVEVLEFEITPNSKINGKSLTDLKFPKSSVVGGVIRNGKGYIPDSQFVFEHKDHVVILSKASCIHKVESFFR